VAELRVGHEAPVDVDRGTDAGAQGQQDHGPHLADTGTEAHLGGPGGVGVVDHPDVALQRSGEGPVGIELDPPGVDVGGRLADPADDDGGEADTHRGVGRGRQLAGDPTDHPVDDGDAGLGGRRLRRRHAVAIPHHDALRDVDRGALDASAPDVDADRDRHARLAHHSLLSRRATRSRSIARRRQG
jgi:hypothetical protein